MKSIKSYCKSLLYSVLQISTFIFSLYLSVVFFVVLLADEYINGKGSERLKEDFEAFIQKITDLPESVFPAEPKKEGADLSGEFSS